MKRILTQIIAPTILLIPVLTTGPVGGPAAAAQKNKKASVENSLAGQKGNVRRRLPRGTSDCGKAVQEYLNASGHSAYASTPMSGFGASGYICSVATDFRSIKSAEARALRGCEAGTKKWKYAYKGKCEIHASK